jgi:hypothetical protein
MNEQKNELNLDNTGIEIKATSSKAKQWLMGLVIAMVCIYLIINIFSKPKKEDLSNSPDLQKPDNLNK